MANGWRLTAGSLAMIAAAATVFACGGGDGAAAEQPTTGSEDAYGVVRWGCPAAGSAARGQAAASAVLRYVLGGPEPAWPTTPQCANVKPNADAWRYWVNQPNGPGNPYVRAHYGVGPTVVCGRGAQVHRFEIWNEANMAVNPGQGLPNAIHDCMPEAVAFFEMTAGFDRYDDETQQHYMTFDADPEAAVLDYGLPTISGASATAKGSASGGQLTVFRFGSSTMPAAGRAWWLGQNCVVGAGAYGSGAWVWPTVQYVGTNSNYITCR